jgi:hypothetical protein
VPDFNKRKSTTENNCGNCYQGIYHLSRGLICGYTDAPTKVTDICGLYIKSQAEAKEAAEVKQEELF